MRIKILWKCIYVNYGKLYGKSLKCFTSRFLIIVSCTSNTITNALAPRNWIYNCPLVANSVYSLTYKMMLGEFSFTRKITNHDLVLQQTIFFKSHNMKPSLCVDWYKIETSSNCANIVCRTSPMSKCFRRMPALHC